MKLTKLAKRCCVRIVNSRMILGVISACALALAILVSLNGYFLHKEAVYDQRHPVASPSVLCPGDSFSYPVSVVVKYNDTAMRITEGWCDVTGELNYCPWALQNDSIWVNMVDADPVVSPQGQAHRFVPVELTVGDWELRHCNTSFVGGQHIGVSCYAVSITVLPPEECK